MPKRFHVVVASVADLAPALERALKDLGDEFCCEEIGGLDRIASLPSHHFHDAAVVVLAGSADLEVVRAAMADRSGVAFIVVMDGDEELAERALAIGVQEIVDLDDVDAHSLGHAIRRGCIRQGLQVEQRQAAAERRQLFANHPFAWLITDPNTLRINDANEAASALYAGTADDLTSRTLLDLTPQADRDCLLDALRSGGAAHVLELAQCRIDGQPFRAAMSLQVAHLANRPVVMALVRDITVRARAIAALERSERRFRDIFQYSLGLLCTHDLQGVILSVNPAAAATLGYDISQLLGRHFTEFMPERHHEEFAQYLERVAALGEDEGVFRLFASDGRSRVWEYRNVLEEYDNGEHVVFGHAQDITHRVLQERELKEEARRDPLTGCWNRRALAQFERRLADGPWHVIVIDLDGFKQINDAQGHVAGDRILAAMGTYLQGLCGDRAQAFRTGGDEFLIVVPGASDQARALRDALARPDGQAPAAFSSGDASRQGGESMVDTIDRADAALYEQRRMRRTSRPG